MSFLLIAAHESGSGPRENRRNVCSDCCYSGKSGRGSMALKTVACREVVAISVVMLDAGPSILAIVSSFLSLSWVITLIDHRACAIVGGFLGLLLRLHCHDHFLDTSHCIRPLFTKALEIKLANELRQRQLPWLLVMVVQLPELFWVHPKFACHLHVLMRQVEPAPRVDPRLQLAGIRF